MNIPGCTVLWIRGHLVHVTMTSLNSVIIKLCLPTQDSIELTVILWIDPNSKQSEEGNKAVWDSRGPGGAGKRQEGGEDCKRTEPRSGDVTTLSSFLTLTGDSLRLILDSTLRTFFLLLKKGFWLLLNVTGTFLFEFLLLTMWPVYQQQWHHVGAC